MTWADPSRYVRHLHVEEGCLELDATRAILERWGRDFEVVPERGRPKGIGGHYPHNLTQGKAHLFLCRNRGRFFKPCPGTREYRCCGYHVLNIGMNCPMDCVYCILQSYLNQPWLSFFVNIDDLFAELDQVTARPGFLRIGTGEFTDSLALDRLTCLAPRLVEYMAGGKRAVLELKTKSAVVDHLLDLDHRGRTIMAWSLNSPGVMAREELRTATLDERLDAAARCARAGYRLAFHFDPIIHHPGWREGYAATIERLFSQVPAEAIAWISLGALRFLADLKATACRRFPASRIFHNEFITGLDGKSRYFRTQREELYLALADMLRQRAHPRTCIYFCMENDTIWNRVLGFTPEERGGLAAMLDKAAR